MTQQNVGLLYPAKSSVNGDGEEIDNGQKVCRRHNSLVEKQDVYTFHRPVMELFARNPYNVTNVINVRECDLKVYRPTQNTTIIIGTFYLLKNILEISLLPRRFGP